MTIAKTSAVAFVAMLALVTSASAGEWTSLFDGESLDDWAREGGTATYRIEDGAIVGKTKQGSKNTFLCKAPYSDFELQFEVKCDKGLNSGVQIRSHVYEEDTPQKSNPKRVRKAGEVYGPQCEIGAYGRGGDSVNGNFWDEGRRTKWLCDVDEENPEVSGAYKAGEWNTYRIVAKGDHYQSFVNGVKIADFNDDMDESGLIGLQVHSIGKNQGPYEVRWRNIKIKELD
ncbi:3-keto-disaccharide hydrolase [Stratiformator vulcanicus]|uniref:3-keto-alpha-glucoside-1,2-lyase/3-keto-2-hydroxy-glucal hydratase domain-containing protein n=1 Tax=Stratiformator vulcanicus TaxID=2527980 RepID=A0A517R533_9PLAN|nr:DUF1080 domain-containing protein [Stratiformator vulcanicus]QDT38998.1 hypothetical protein Pan189_33990 [Stratiformator vulcanicus]